MERYPFVVNETPYCIWDMNINQTDLDFLNMIDPHYFQHVAMVNGELLEGESSHYAAITLRTAYSHALETFFALLCATIQVT
jgi:hypothetical protein